MYTQAENTSKKGHGFVLQKSRTLRQEINIVDNRPEGIIPNNFISRDSWTQMHMRCIPAKQDNLVVQLQKLKLSLRSMFGWDNDKTSQFWAYVAMKGWTCNKASREVDTGETGPATVTDLISGFDAFLVQTEGGQVVAPRATREDLKEKQERDVASVMTLFKEQYYPKVEIMTGLDGKRNAGIYEIPSSQDMKYPLIAKLIYKSEKVEDTYDNRMVDKFGKVQLFRQHNPQPEEGWELCVPEGDYMYVGKGADFTIYIVLYKKMPGKTLEKHIQDKIMLKLDTVGEKVALFHLSAMKVNGKYLIHKDLNTSNIMLDESGFMSLVDTDDIEYTDDPAYVKADITTLLNMLGSSMQRNEYPPETIKTETINFIIGYEKVMAHYNSKLVEEIKANYIK